MQLLLLGVRLAVQSSRDVLFSGSFFVFEVSVLGQGLGLEVVSLAAAAGAVAAAAEDLILRLRGGTFNAVVAAMR